MSNKERMDGLMPAEQLEARLERIDREIGLLQLEFVQVTIQREPVDTRQEFWKVLDTQTMQLVDADEGESDVEGKSAKRQDAFKALKSDIEKLYEDQQSDWKERILERLAQFKKEWRTEKKKEPPPYAGVFAYNTKDGSHDLERFGIDSEDNVLGLHVKDSVDLKATLSSSAIRRSLGILAETIVEKYPDVRAVVGRSWLIDHPIAKRLGFTIVEEVEISQRGNDFWFQFIDINGHVDRERAKKFLETGEAPYQAKLGMIPVEAFLKRYLSDEKRKEPVALKKIREEWKDEDRLVKQETMRLSDSWSDMTGEEIEPFFQSSPVLKRRLNELGLLKTAIEQFRMERQAGHSLGQLKENKEIVRIGDALRAREETQKYETVEVDLSSYNQP